MTAATWEALEATAKRAVRHLAAVRTVEAADGYTREMALRHALQCGERELADAVSLLQRLNRKSAGFSLLSLDCRKAYLALRALEFEEMASPSEVEPETLVDAIKAAKELAERLIPDVARIRKETQNA